MIVFSKFKKEKPPLQKLVEDEGYKKLINFDGYVWWREDLVKKAITLTRKEERSKRK